MSGCTTSGKIDGEPMMSNSNALIADPGYRHDYILTNPPFGKKSSMTFTNEEGEQEKKTSLTTGRISGQPQATSS
ncbi:MAG: hypothetical protein PHF18_05965 [Methanosarcina sp.]|uniref:hypothetical protein n=1 Tax=Methanosarcina sp. TaxID=2213 RepID=UPI00262E38AE|nr:hypothetical protein [Methanosarcina sp.]MDD3246384.1 hypothetical protein [Methanosarcina sp.]